ncbi:MAG: metallophosphoesterase [Saprospiraceae bacterium]
MGRLIFLLFLALIFIGLDIYTYHGMHSIMGYGRFSRAFKYVYWGISIFTYVSIFQIFFYFLSTQGQHRTEYFNFISGFIFTVLVTKLVFSALMIFQDGGRLIVGSMRYLKYSFLAPDTTQTVFIPERREFLTTFSSIAAGIPFFGMLYGITKGKYQYTVQKVVLTFKDLPNAFDGFKIVQISDIHAGSFDNKEKVRLGIEKINALNPDLVCFTGDLVNAEKDEIDPYIDIFSEIKSSYGKFAILGNHDYYGSYDRNNPAAEQSYFEDFFSKFKKMGFDLLNNENRTIVKSGQYISLLGVENWGAGHWFPKRGDLDKATSGLSEDGFKILMSHDPTHWDEKVIHHDRHVHLTLSGHTHGFQFGFQLPGFQWSPAQYRYPKWLGLYGDNDRFLYVNRGFGFLGFPGRVGMWPEITLIELRSGQESTI